MSVGHSPVSEAVALLSAGDVPSPLHQQISLLHSQISWVQSQTEKKKKKKLLEVVVKWAARI